MIYRIIYHAHALQELEKLGRDAQRKIIRAIEQRLTQAPEIYGKPLRYSLKGLWALRAGDYRIIYNIEKEEILVLRIGHRREVYNR